MVAALESVSEDFGHVLRGSPAGLACPRTAEEVAEVVTHAVSSGSRLTLRGVGHSAGGQALPADSVVVDLSRMNGVGSVDLERRTVHCEAGALLRDVVAATLEHRLLPRALTNLLDLTVGGLLSVGGVGPGSHRHGPLIANVASLEVVTGHGSRHRCSRGENRELYDAVLGGLGRCGVIVSAELELRPARSRVRTYHLLYDDLSQWLADQRALARTDGLGSMEGFCSPSLQGLRGTGGRRASFAEWFFPLQVSFEFDEAAPELPRDLSPYRVVHVEDDEIAYFPVRHDARFEAVRRLGAWERPHPYIGAFIGAEALGEVLPAVLDTLPLGEGHRGTFFVAADDVPPLMALPDAEDLVFVAIIYPQVLPHLLNDTLGAFERAGDLLVGAGGKRYVADWLGDVDEDGWRRHFGSSYDWWVESKRRFDPHGVFCSLLLP
ncbi:MAG TPA: FAD-binding protein [Thermoleophilaceae bacterium]|nr:FAD-binding protein [Thermoleophilaceae bacterium]